MLPHPLTRRLRLESLEHRLNPTSTLFVDFGDNFPAAGLTGTIGELKTATSGVPGDPAVQGPDMDGSTNGDWDVGNDNDNTNDMDNADTFDLVSFVDRYTADGGNYPGGLAQLRADIMTMLRRFYEPFDIDVIELTSTPIDVNGRMVASATSLADISSTLGANETTAKNNDSYVMLGAMVVHRPAAAGGDFDPATMFGGYASVIDMPDTNDNDNSAVCYLDPGDLAGATSAGFWAYLIAHEAGHTFGFQHSLTQAPGPNVSPLIPQSEIMSYLTGNGFNFFSRYPIVRGNANTNNNDDLMAVSPPAPAANRTPYDQWINTPSIGQNNAFHYITGTGAHDIITITLTGANQATVAVEAFSDAAYTNALTVPGSAGASTTYSYNLALDRPFVIDGGALNDRVVLDGDLGITLTVRGMDGTDEVVVMGKNAATATYTPATSTANGLDGNADLRGVVAIGTTTINVQELEATSRLLIQDVTTVNFTGSAGSDALTFDQAAGNVRTTGTVNSGTAFVPLELTNVGTYNANGNAANDTFTLAVGYVSPGGFTLNIVGGTETDTLVGGNVARTFTITGVNAGTVNTTQAANFSSVENLEGGSASDSFVFNGGSLTGTINGGASSDTITGDNNPRTFNITGANAGNIGGVLTSGFISVENLVGGSAGDTFAFGGAGSLTGTINGGDGGDLIDGNDAPHTYTINGANTGTVSELLPAGFTNIESLVGGTGVDQFTFVAGGSLTGTIDGEGGVDTMTGDDTARTFTVTGANAGSVSTILTNGFTNIENLVGGAFDDAFNFNVGGSLTGTIDGGAGTDTITGDNNARTLTITLPNAGNVSAILPAGFTNVENLAGGTQGDTFTFNNGGSLAGTIDGNGGNDIINGDDGGRTFTLTALNQGTISDILPAGFSDIETLNGGIGADALVVANNNGAIDGFFDGKGNVDTVDLSLKTVAQLIVVQASGVNGFNTTGGTAATGGFRDIDRLFGSTTATTDRLTGLPENAQWQVRAGADQSFYRLAASGRTLFFNQFEVLIGSTKTDHFTVNFNAGNPLSAAGLTVAGMGGTDTLKAIGTANADNFKLLSQQLHVNGNILRFTTMEYVDGYGGAGNDAFYSPGTAVLSSLKLIRFYGEEGNDLALVDPKTTTPYYLHGGNGTDKLTVNRGTARFKAPLPSRTATSGTYNFTNRQLIQFVSFETKDIGVLQPQP